MKVYQCINAIQAELSKVGISKDQKNTQQGFKFRGIDDVLNTLSPLLAQHGLCILPTVLERQVTERTTKNGGVLFYVALMVEYHFVCAEDGSTHRVIVYGEAMDSGDKATNKALSAAYKYACIQAFCIPTEGDNDADSITHEVIATPLQLLIRLIEDNHLQDKVSSWCEYFKVSDIAQLSNADIKKLIVKIEEMDK